MRHERRGDAGGGLPHEWLPAPQPPEGAPEWDARFDRIMAAARPELHEIALRGAAASGTPWSWMALWWKPAAALTAAATTLLVLTARPPTGAAEVPPQASLSLSMVAADGDPVTLWGAFGIEADPVLALIAVRMQDNPMGAGARSAPVEGER